MGDAVSLREKIQEIRARKKVLSSNPGLWLGKSVAVSDSVFEGSNRIGDHSYINSSSFGKYTYIGPRCIVNYAILGRYCAIAPDVMIGTGGHPIEQNVSVHPLFYLNRPEIGWDFSKEDHFNEFGETKIGHDVWIGTKVTIRDGITVGNGAVVGAGAVVVRNLEPFGIYVGAPARLLRFRYPSDIIERLEAFSWWDRDLDWLRDNAEAFADVSKLLAL